MSSPPPELDRVGVADLYPGARGGGMLYDPFYSPRGDIPPNIGIPGRLPPYVYTYGQISLLRNYI